MSIKTFYPAIQGFLGSALCLVLFWGVNGNADGNPATENVPRVIPYEGTIELDGAAYTGTLDMRFTLYDDADTSLWNETYSVAGDSGAPVDVYAGSFSVLLGEFVDLSTVILDAEELYVGVTISTDDFATETALAGRQLVGPAPFAIWAAAAADFTVSGLLSANGGLYVAGDATTTGYMHVGGADLTLGTLDGRDQGSNPGQRALVHTGSDGLYINFAGDFEGGTIIQSDTTIQGNASVTGDSSVSATATVGSLSVTGGATVGTSLNLPPIILSRSSRRTALEMP